MQKDGMNYVPEGKKPEPVVKPGEFQFAAMHLDHGHIFADQINGFINYPVIKMIYIDNWMKCINI